MQAFSFTCPKCSGTECETGEMRAAGGFWSKIFNIQTRRFSTVTCARCRYTEIYQAHTSSLGNVFDFFTN